MTTGALATLAGALGGVLDRPARALEPAELALLVGAFAVHGLVSTGVHAVLRDVRTALVLAVPVVAAGAVAALAGGSVSAAGLGVGPVGRAARPALGCGARAPGVRRRGVGPGARSGAGRRARCDGGGDAPAGRHLTPPGRKGVDVTRSRA